MDRVRIHVFFTILCIFLALSEGLPFLICRKSVTIIR